MKANIAIPPRLKIPVRRQYLNSIETVFGSPGDPPESKVSELFFEALTMSAGVYVIVDEVDVLEEEQVRCFFRLFKSAAENGSFDQVKFLMFSREILGRGIDLTKQLSNTTVLPVSISNLRGDIERFVHHEVDRKQQECAITKDKTLLDEIKKVLIDRADKM
jgi:hypothetical protein